VGKSSVNIKERAYKNASRYIFGQGIRGWSMDTLAADSGVTKRTLYKVIPSKEELVEQVVMQFIEGVQERIGAIIDSGTDYFSTMERIIESFPLFLDRINSRVFKDIFLEYPGIEEQVYKRRAELTTRLAAFFKTGIERGYLKSGLQPELVLEMYQALVLYFIKSGPQDGGYSARIKTAFHALLYGIAAVR
jgi:AcrR family transcriptional regulator